MKEILITNDDGYESDGLHALIEAVRPLGHVTIVAPASEKSACGHSLTLTRPLRFVGVDDDFYKLDDGTPADCIYLALHSLFEGRKPDLVISGINRGANLGEDITYSGTVAGAMEAVLHGVPAIAISQVMTKTEDGRYDYDLSLAAQAAREMAERVLGGGFPLDERRLLNINIPNLKPEQAKGYRVTRASWRNYANDAHRHTNPRGEEYFWLGLHPLDFNETENGDFEATQAGYISLTPVQCDLTCHRSLEKLDQWLK